MATNSIISNPTELLPPPPCSWPQLYLKKMEKLENIFPKSTTWVFPIEIPPKSAPKSQLCPALAQVPEVQSLGQSEVPPKKKVTRDRQVWTTRPRIAENAANYHLGSPT